MAIIACQECKAEISSTAATCPRCGAPQKKQKKKGIGCLGAIGLVVGLGILASIITSNQQAETERGRVAALTPAQKKAEADKKAAEQELHSAMYACKMFIEKSLHDPGSAEFENSADWRGEKQADGVYHVQIKVRARNAFNALRQSLMDCKTKLNGDNWVALSVTQIDS